MRRLLNVHVGPPNINCIETESPGTQGRVELFFKKQQQLIPL